MVIKYSDKFESIFYAVLCANISGYFLAPKSQPTGLFEEEEFIDIDTLNWQELIMEHNRKFGEIKWFNNNKKFFSFRDDINLVLRFWQPFKYKAVIDIIKIALKYGLNYLETDDIAEIKYLQGIIKQINNEVLLAVGYLNLIPAVKGKDKFLLGEFNEESKIGDLVLQKLQQKYFGYNFILRSPKFIYIYRENKVIICESKKDNSGLSLAKLLEQIYQDNMAKDLRQDKQVGFGLDFMALPNLAFG